MSTPPSGGRALRVWARRDTRGNTMLPARNSVARDAGEEALLYTRHAEPTDRHLQFPFLRLSSHICECSLPVRKTASSNEIDGCYHESRRSCDWLRAVIYRRCPPRPPQTGPWHLSVWGPKARSRVGTDPTGSQHACSTGFRLSGGTVGSVSGGNCCRWVAFSHVAGTVLMLL